MRESELRQEIVEVCRRMYGQGLIAAGDGNVSAKLDEQSILVTPSGFDKGRLKEFDLIVVDRLGRKLRGAHLPSSEFRMHQLAYELRPDIRAVIHAHPPVTVGLALAGFSMAQCILSETCLVLGAIPTAPYATPTTEEVPESLRPYLGRANAIVLDRHGALTLGRTLEEAYQRLEAMEHASKATYVARSLGPVTPLGPRETARLERLAGELGIARPPQPCQSCNACSRATGPANLPGASVDERALVDEVVRRIQGAKT